MFKVTRSDFQAGNLFQNVWLSNACRQANSLGTVEENVI
jgi:hypothetical protein